MKKTKNQKAKKNVTYERTYKDLAINTGVFKNLGLYKNMLKPIHDQIQVLLTHHSRIQLLRFDLHLPVTEIIDASSGNLVVSKFFKQTNQVLASGKWNHQNNVIFGWAREIGESDNGHYHCYLGTSSTARLGTPYGETPTQLWELIYNRWSKLSGGSVRPSDTNHHIVNRGNRKQLSNAFYHLSYMCKVRSKDFGTGEHHKRHSNSRLKPKEMTDQHPAFDIDHIKKTSDLAECQIQFSDYAPRPERTSVQLMAVDDGAVVGNDALDRRSMYRGSKTRKVADQQITADCHMMALEQFFAFTIESSVATPMQA